MSVRTKIRRMSASAETISVVQRQRSPKRRVARRVAAAASTVLMAGLGVGLTPQSAAAATCLDGSMCLWADPYFTGTLYPWIPADQLVQPNVCFDLGWQYSKITTSAKNLSHRNVVLFEGPECTGRSLTFPPLTVAPDLRAHGFDDTASSVLVP